MVCLFWAVFFAVRGVLHTAEMRVNNAVLLFFVATTVLYAGHWMYFSGMPSFAGEWSYSIVNLCVYPLFYMYLRELVRTREGSDAPWLLLPAGIVALVFPLNRWLGWQVESGIQVFARISFAVQVAWVWVRGFQLLRNAKRRMDDTYSDYRSDLLRPINVLLQLFGITAVASMVLNMIGREFFTEGLLAGIPAVIMSVLLYGLGYVAAETVVPPEKAVQPETLAEELSSKSDESDALMQKIDKAMREQELFRNESLTIHDLASAIHSNRTYISNCINRNCGLSFSQYVAGFRVAYARQILADPNYESDHDAIADAIAQSGFTADQSFYRVFKEIAGMTPLQYRQQQIRKS